MPVVGIAEVEVRPVFNGLQNQISRQIGGAADRAGRSAGSKMGAGMAAGFAANTAKIVGGLATIIPAAGAASAAVLAAGGSVVTFTASLSSLAGVAALVPAGLMSITAGAGTLITAFSGMGEALKTAVDAGNAISTINPRLAAMAIEDAMRAISDAEENAADARESAARRVADAKRSLAEAVEDAAEAQVAAAKSVEMAERSEARAARDVIKAQKDLVKAREEAAEKLNRVGESLDTANRRAIETAEAYKNAAALYEAAKADPSSRINELAQLERNAAVALATDKAARTSVVELRDLHTKAQSEAEDSNEKVLDAEQRLADARQSQTDAIQDRKDAQADVLKQEKDGAQQIADAQQAITDATKEAEKSQLDSARAISDAYRGLERVQLQQADAAAATGAKAAAAMDKLTPSAREAALALLAVKDQLGGIRRIAQENFFKGFAAPLLSLAGSVMPQLATGVGAIASAMGAGAKTYMGALESSMGGGVLESLLMGVAKNTKILNTAITPVVEAFTTLGVVGMPYMARLSQFIADMATRFNDFITATAADGRLVAWIDGGIQTLKDLWSIAGDVVGVFGSINKAAEAGGLGSTVSGLASGMSRLDELMKGETFQTTMTTIFGGAAKGADGLKESLDNIAGAFVRGAPALAEFLRLGGEIAGTFIGGVFDGFSDPTFGAGMLTFMEGLKGGAETVAPLLPGLFAGFGRFLDAIAPIVERFGPTLVVIFTDIANGVAAVIEFLSPFLTLVAGSPVTVGLLVGVLATAAITMKTLTLAGNIQSTAMRLWAVSVAIVKGALYVLSLQWIRTAAAAVVSGAQTAYVWALYRIDAIKSAAVHVAQSARVVGGWVAMSAAAVVSGIKTAAVWTGTVVAQAAKGAVAFAIQVGRVVGGWVLMGAQSLLQAGRMALAWVIAMGPIGWIIAAVVGLVALVIANWDTISKFTADAWANITKWVTDAINFVVAWVQSKVLWLQATWHLAWTTIKNTVSEIWNGITTTISDAFNFVAAWIQSKLLWVQAIWALAWMTIKNKVSEIWNGITTTISDVWEKGIKPVFDNLANFITKDVPKAFEQGVKWIGEAWAKLQDLAKAPVRFVVDTVINKGLIDGLNGIGNFLNLPDIPHVALPPGFADGGYTGPGGKYQPAGIVHAGEIVWSQDDISRWGGVGIVESLRKAAGFALGGLVHPLRASTVSQPFHGGHNGIDFAAPTGTPIGAAGPGRVSSAGWSPHGGGNEIHIDHPNGLQTWYAHLSSFAVRMGDMVKAGQRIGEVGSTGNSTGPHLHYMVMNGGWPNYVNPSAYLDGGGEPGKGGWNPIAGIIDGLLSSFKSAFPAAGFIADLAIGAGKKILDGAVDFITGRGGKDDGIGTTGLPYLHDNGGVLNPGLSSIVNATRKPEAIYTFEQNRALQALAARGAQQGNGRGDVIFKGNVGWDPHEVAHAIETKRRDTFAAFGI